MLYFQMSYFGWPCVHPSDQNWSAFITGSILYEMLRNVQNCFPNILENDYKMTWMHIIAGLT